MPLLTPVCLFLPIPLPLCLIPHWLIFIPLCNCLYSSPAGIQSLVSSIGIFISLLSIFFRSMFLFITVPLAPFLSSHFFSPLSPLHPSYTAGGCNAGGRAGRQVLGNGGENRICILKLLWERVYFNQNFNKISEGYIQHRLLELQWFIFGSAISNWKQRLMIETFWQPHSLASELCHLIQHAVYLTVSVKLLLFNQGRYI